MKDEGILNVAQSANPALWTVAKVVTDVPKQDGILDYAIPGTLRGKIRPGSLVAVPVANDFLQGVVADCTSVSSIQSLKEIICLIDEEPVLTAAQLQLARILSERTLTPLNICVNTLLPEKIRRCSYAEYRVIGAPAVLDDHPVQPDLFNGEMREPLPLRDRMLIFIRDFERESGAPVSEDTLSKAFPEPERKMMLARLVNAGVLERTLRFGRPILRKKTIRTLFLSDAGRTLSEMAIFETSRDPEIQARRVNFIARLRADRRGIPVPDAIETGVLTDHDLNVFRKRGWIEVVEVEAIREVQSALPNRYPSAAELDLNPAQAAALAAIQADLRRAEIGAPILIRGITGSGKTEIYLRAAAEALSRGKQVLMLVPEIALTPQIVIRFRERFPGLIGVYHSKLSAGQRFDAWRRGRDRSVRILIGTRSAFAVPLPDLGLILMDECHDDSYYQTEGRPFFSAGPLAVEYARISGATVVLGSATPTVAQRFKAEQSGWTILELPNRAGAAKTPLTTVVDMRGELRAGNRSIFSRGLVDALTRTLDQGRQAILFMNRRGAAAYVFCSECGMSFSCPNCDVNLTLHSAMEKLSCHFCGYKTAMPDVCPSCGSTAISRFSAGIETVEAITRETFPAARILRLDAESVEKKGSMEEILTKFANREADILIGTRMVSKGLDFPDVAIVGVILAEVGGGLQDFRVEEQIFQLMTQVIGRAGRGNQAGQAIIQTYQPDRYSLRAAVSNDYDAFYREELAYRRRLGYPPFTRLARILIRNSDSERAAAESFRIAGKVRLALHGKRAICMIGPAPCFYSRLNGYYRWQVLLRGVRIAEALKGFDFGHARFEMDPVSVL